MFLTKVKIKILIQIDWLNKKWYFTRFISLLVELGVFFGFDAKQNWKMYFWIVCSKKLQLNILYDSFLIDIEYKCLAFVLKNCSLVPWDAYDTNSEFNQVINSTMKEPVNGRHGTLNSSW